MEKTVVRIRWGIPSCAYVFFPTVGVFFVCSDFGLESLELSRFYSAAHDV